MSSGSESIHWLLGAELDAVAGRGVGGELATVIADLATYTAIIALVGR